MVSWKRVGGCLVQYIGLSYDSSGSMHTVQRLRGDSTWKAKGHNNWSPCLDTNSRNYERQSRTVQIDNECL